MKRIAGWEFQRLDGVAAEQPWVSPIGFGALPISYRNGVIVRLPGGRLLVHRYRSAKSRLKALEERRKVDPALLASLAAVELTGRLGAEALERIAQAIEQDAARHRDTTQVGLEVAEELRVLRDKPRVVPDWVRRRRRRGFEAGYRHAMSEAVSVVKAALR